MGESVIDGRADIYALGCVAYWLLTGKYLFEARTSMQLVFSHANTEPVPPSQRSEVPIPRRLEELVMSCLAKRPADRPASTDDLAAALQGAVPHEAWTHEEASRWWRTHLPELA